MNRDDIDTAHSCNCVCLNVGKAFKIVATSLKASEM
jgi:hypothetical protein